MSKQSYRRAAFDGLEEQLIKLAGKVREMRITLDSGPLDEVALKMGTFVHYVNECEGLAEKYLGEIRQQQRAKRQNPQEK